MSVTVTYQSTITVVETLEGNAPAATDANKKVTHNAFNTSKSLTGASSQPVTKCAFFEQALAAGVATIDLTALTGTNGASVDMSGLKVQQIKFKNKAGNNVVTIGEGALNGYELAGSGWQVALQAGQEFVIDGNDATPDVGAAAKEIDLAGTGTDEIEVSIVCG